MSLRPSPSPSPAPPNNLKPINTRASLQPTQRDQPIPRTPNNNQNNNNSGLHSPRPLGINTSHGRPTSELLNPGQGVAFQTPEVDAIDQWFENLQNYETTLEEMAAASLDVNFKEELSAIEQWFRVLSEAERTAALYSLLQHSTQMQIRFFITVLQQMARSDPMTALLSPNVGASMQNQMEAKLASMGLKSPALPASPSTQRTFGSSLTSGLNRQSMAGGDPSSPMVSSFLSPDSANNLPTNNDSGSSAAAATLAQQRAKLKANAAHRISAPGTLSQQFASTVQSWPSSSLGQVVERAPSPNNQPPAQTRSNSNDSKLSPPLPVPSSARPKSTDFTGVANSFRSPGLGRVQNEDSGEGVGQNMLSPMIGGNWASMVNTPVNPMFSNSTSNNDSGMDQAAAKLASWGSGAGSGRMVLDDARKFRRTSAANVNAAVSKNSGEDQNSVVYGDDGEPIQQQQQQQLTNRNVSGGSTGFANGLRNGGANGGSNNNSWQNQNPRSPALSSTRFGGGGNAGLNDDALNSANFANQAQQQQLQQAHAQAQALAMAQMAGGFNMFGLQNGMSSPLMNGGFNGLQGMGGLQGQFGAPGMDGLAQLNQMQQAQLFAAQLAAGGYNPAAAFGMAGLSPAGNNGARGPGGGGSRAGGRTPSNRGGTSANGRSGGGGDKDKEEEVDVSLLNDVPGWLRSLRLHKYTPNFEGVGWKEMVVMDEAKLEQMGVAALGARRKLLKTFEAVRAKMGIADPNASAGGEQTAAGGDDAAPDSSEA